MGSFNACSMAIGLASTYLCPLGFRAAKSACICSLGCKVSVRRVVPVQDARLGQTFQSLWENFTLMSDLPASWTGVQLELIRPCGQITLCASQLMENCVRS